MGSEPNPETPATVDELPVRAKTETPLTVENVLPFALGYFVVGPLLMLAIGLVILAVKWIAS